ncbi:hypothetical protein HOU40_gp086 [Lactobacillus phage Bromius]|uniref:Uncharacterized protein n=1 Tax=Lactobacillus phage Bromius TaxID=2315485 RepID=A0A3S7UPY7_9CAUD|nr:hypothetical protein HOU40_gp086 [Lactobacillus phage Bromius]AYH92322.1 hypothetical protein [Lactobacillus phage Bromius]
MKEGKIMKERDESNYIVDAGEVAEVLIYGRGKIGKDTFVYKDYIYPNGRPQGEMVIANESTNYYFSIVVSSRIVNNDTYIDTTKGSKQIEKLLAPYTDYKVKLTPMCSTTSKSIVYYNQENVIDNLPNILGQVIYGINATREYYELYKKLFDGIEGYILYDVKEGYVYLSDTDYIRGDTKLQYTNSFNQNVITASSVNLLKAILQSRYAKDIVYPISVFKYTADDSGNKMVDLGREYGKFTSPEVFTSNFK